MRNGPAGHAGYPRLGEVVAQGLAVAGPPDIAALKARFPGIRGPDVKDMCYATQNRQSAVRLLVDRCDVMLVIGADYSSNSNRLQEIGTEAGIDSYLIPDAASLNPAWLDDARTVESPPARRPRKSSCRRSSTGSATCSTSR